MAEMKERKRSTSPWLGTDSPGIKTASIGGIDFLLYESEFQGIHKFHLAVRDRHGRTIDLGIYDSGDEAGLAAYTFADDYPRGTW